MPECEKLRAVKEKSQAIGEFLDWLSSQGIVLAAWNTDGCDRLELRRGSIEELLAEYFNIDLDKVETEKRALLDDLRQ